MGWRSESRVMLSTQRLAAVAVSGSVRRGLFLGRKYEAAIMNTAMVESAPSKAIRIDRSPQPDSNGTASPNAQ